ncbi:hypothetical protein WH95_13550 [Kiloniella litopenaei]|uniref:Uncharacterized protein n=2 Tax=Kiloniella litopenaei TaxID=1549748 RepID=A0A0M2R8B5_9PROT|nr:hypothetical protein WH95_13550 [Kiloniella litopenaei]
MIVMSFLAVPLRTHADSGTTNDISKEEYCREFKRIAFSNEEELLSRWDTTKLRVFLDGESKDVIYAKELFNKFSELSGIEIIYTRQKINIGLVFWDNSYRYALVTGEKLLKTWLPTKLDLFEYLKENAKEGNKDLVLQYSFNKSKKMILSIGIFDVPIAPDPSTITQENKDLITRAVITSLFPSLGNEPSIKFSGEVEEIFSPLTNAKHQPLAQIWYGENVHAGRSKNSFGC